jgi:hypothetical protein
MDSIIWDLLQATDKHSKIISDYMKKYHVS